MTTKDIKIIINSNGKVVLQIDDAGFRFQRTFNDENDPLLTNMIKSALTGADIKFFGGNEEKNWLDPTDEQLQSGEMSIYEVTDWLKF